VKGNAEEGGERLAQKQRQGTLANARPHMMRSAGREP
jgi:hypothetical protein